MTGTFASAASIARLHALYRYFNTEDVPYDAIQILLWTQIEVNVAIISASAPSLRPLFASIFKGSSYGRGGPSSARYGGYGSSYGREESHYRRTLTRHGHNHGAIELTSRDEELYTGRVHGVTQPSPKARKAVDGESSSQEHILDHNPNIMKTVVVEMTREDRK